LEQKNSNGRPNPLDLTVCPTPDVMAFPLRIVPKLRTCLVCSKRFQDLAWCPVLEPLRTSNRLRLYSIQGPVSLSIGGQNSKCHQKLPELEIGAWSLCTYM
jgi:hypothetical protein